MSKPVELVTLIPDCGDWEALYLNGKLIAEGHQLSVDNILEALADVFPNEHQYMNVSDEKAESGFTENLADMFA